MLSQANSFGLTGLNGFPVKVEVDISAGLPAYETVGLPDAAVKESRERVRAALKNSGFEFPTARITVSLAPADVRKEGSVYDLPIALAILCADGRLKQAPLVRAVYLGELALNGDVRPVNGVLPMVIAAQQRGESVFFVPRENAQEAACAAGVRVFPVENLAQLVAFLRGEGGMEPQPRTEFAPEDAAYPFDFADIRGQAAAKRAAEIAAAGGHNLLLAGTPGSGKTMLSRAIPSILPPMTLSECMEVTSIPWRAIGAWSRPGPSGRPITGPPRRPSPAAGPTPCLGRSAWPTWASCSWMSFRNSIGTCWRACASPWRTASSPSPGPA